MSRQIYINGSYFAPEDAKISVYDHGLLYGDGVFEGLRTYTRESLPLARTLGSLSMNLHAQSAWRCRFRSIKLTDDVNETVAKNELHDGYIRLVVTRGSGALGLDPVQVL